jgi:ADP-ribose pyrophosphatase
MGICKPRQRHKRGCDSRRISGEGDPHRSTARPTDPNATPEGTAIKELEEETGFTAERVERLGEFLASPGMLSESFTLVRAHGVRKIGEGGGDENEDINVHLVAREDIPNFIEQKRAEGFGVDVKLLMFMNF